MDHEVKIYEKAEIDYMNGIKYKEIAEKYKVALSTVKSWKTRYGWDRKGKKSMRTKLEKVCIQKAVVEEAVEKIEKTNELTDKEKLFCLYYIRCFNATKAYMKAYNTKYESAAVLGCRLLKQEKIQNTIIELKQNRLNREMLSEEDIFQRYMDIAFADLNEFVEIKGNNIKFKDSNSFDGSLVKKITSGKTNSIELLDKAKALQWLSDHMNMATEEQKVRIEVLKSKTQSDEVEAGENDGFIEALEGKVDDIWQKE